MTHDAHSLPANPTVTVSVVSDYRAGESKSWEDIRATLAALADQDFDESVEFVLLMSEDELKQMPGDIPGILPEVQVLTSNHSSSYELKNIGIRSSRADLVLVLDADCVPERGWVRAGVEAMRARPDAVAISGRTTYLGRTTLERSLGLLSRAYVDRGNAAPVRLLSTNNMIVRREVFLANPLPQDVGPFAYRLLTERLIRRGGKLYFEPGMKVVHDFEGWPMERDMRRQVGWTSIRIRQLDEGVPGARVVRRLGPVAIPLLYAYRLAESTAHAFRLPRHFGLNWYHVPLLLVLAPVVHALEVPGMMAAFRGDQAGESVYR